MKSAVCVVIRDDPALLLEWLGYHLAIGFDAALVFDNRSTDATRAVADTAAQFADVRVFDWPFTHGRRQQDGYIAACRESEGEFDWLALLDADEFLLPLQHAGVREWLAQPIFADADAIAVNWAMFGSSGRETACGGLTIETYLARAPDAFAANHHVKSVVRPRRVTGMPNPHAVTVAGRTVDVLGADADWATRVGMTRAPVGLATCRVNHYFTRSRADWARRLARGQVTRRSWDDFSTYDRNDVADTSILTHAPGTRAVMARLGASNLPAAPAATQRRPARVTMSDDELALLENILRKSTDFAEFGVGGGSLVAHRLGCRSAIAADTSNDWLGALHAACPPSERTVFRTIALDIGPVRELGFPAGNGARAKWPRYHAMPWSDPWFAVADTYLIDGRFRVACMMQSALRAPELALLLIHDFADRSYYHPIRAVLREVARTGQLSVFQTPEDFDRDAAARLLHDHALDPR